MCIRDRPWRDGRLSWLCWLTDSGRCTHKVVKQPSISLAQDKESPPARTDVLTTMLHHQAVDKWAADTATDMLPEFKSRYIAYTHEQIYALPTSFNTLILQSLTVGSVILRSTVLINIVHTNLQLVSTSRMRLVMLTHIPHESRPKTARCTNRCAKCH